MLKSSEGKWILFAAETGEQAEFWPIDGKALIASGSHTMEPPAGVDAVMPPSAPKRVGVPQAASVQTFVTEEGGAPPTAKSRAKAG